MPAQSSAAPSQNPSASAQEEAPSQHRGPPARGAVALSPQRQLRALLRARWRRTVNQVSRVSPLRIAISALLGLGVPAGTIAAGVFAAQPMARIAALPPEPGQAVTAGGVFTNVGFWLAALLIAVFSFRIMEGLYRKQDVRLLAAYPIALEVQFLYRLIATGLEMNLSVALAALFFAPVGLLTGDWRALGGFAVVMGGGFIALTLGFAIQLGAGVANFGESPAPAAPRHDDPHGGESLATKLGRLDAGGGFPAAFYMSPAIGLIGSLTLMFLFKLAVVDEFFSNTTSRLFWSGCAITLIACVIATAMARRYFLKHYPYLLAKFYESDLIQFDTGYNYHTSVTGGRKGLLERLVPGRVLPHYRKDRLQFGRRYPLLRLLHVAFWILAALGTEAQWLTPWMQATAPVIYLALLVAPWSRLYGHELEPGMLRKLPAKPGGVWLGKVMVMISEALIVATPAAIAIAVLARDPLVGAVAWLTPLGLIPLMASIAGRSTPNTAWLIGAALAGCSALLGWLVMPAAVALLALLALPGLFLMPRLRAERS